MRRVIAAFCAGAVLIGGAATAAAHTTSTPTEVVFVDGAQTSSPDTLHVQGYLNTSSKCRANRRVKIFFIYSGSPEWTLVDEDRSSLNGNWSGSGPIKGNYSQKIRVTRRNVGPPGHKHICEPDTLIHPNA